MTFDVTIRDIGGVSLDEWHEVKDFITYVKLGNNVETDRISEMGDKFISVDIYPGWIRTRYRGDNGKDRMINYIYTENVLGFDIKP